MYNNLMNEKKENKQCIAFLIGKVGQKLRNKLNHSLKKYDLTAEQRQIILVLLTYGSMSQRKLCEITMSEPSNLNITIKRMEKNDYIKKVRDPKDKRASLIEVTQKACNLKDILKESGTMYKAPALKGINQEKINIAIEVLQQMHENILEEEHKELIKQKSTQSFEIL